MEEYHDIDVWLRIYIKGFKYALMNELAIWGLLFKNYLRDKVINSLQVNISKAEVKKMFLVLCSIFIKITCRLLPFLYIPC